MIYPTSMTQTHTRLPIRGRTLEESNARRKRPEAVHAR